MRGIRIVCVAAALVIAAMVGQGRAAAPASGVVLAVVQSANVDGATGQKTLAPEASVYSGDRIDTGAVGSAQIRFRDDTKLVVGPNSSMVIDAFVFSDNNTARQISINAVKGAFRFFTGTSPKDAYSITTPTATIGVRGTQFDISIEPEGTTRVANFEGMTHICQRQPGAAPDPKTCVDVHDPCSLSVIRPTEPGVVRYDNKDTEFRNRQLKYYFPYVRSQQGLLSDFQVDLRQCKFAAEFSPSAPPSPPGTPTPPTPPVPPPVPGPPTPLPPDFTPPGPPDLTPRDHDRPTYDHGAVLR